MFTNLSLCDTHKYVLHIEHISGAQLVYLLHMISIIHITLDLFTEMWTVIITFQMICF